VAASAGGDRSRGGVGCGVVAAGGRDVDVVTMGVEMDTESENVSRNNIPKMKFSKWEELAEELMRYTAMYGTQSLA
nr:hypothetical protein [Tanacetum cinerariifolium]